MRSLKFEDLPRAMEEVLERLQNIEEELRIIAAAMASRNEQKRWDS